MNLGQLKGIGSVGFGEFLLGDRTGHFGGLDFGLGFFEGHVGGGLGVTGGGGKRSGGGFFLVNGLCEDGLDLVGGVCCAFGLSGGYFGVVVGGFSVGICLCDFRGQVVDGLVGVGFGGELGGGIFLFGG